MSLKDLTERLSRYREITITVTGRKSGNKISRPVWFVFEGDTVYLLPVRGSDSEWYKNILHNPSIQIAARDADGKFKSTPVSDAKAVGTVVEKFRAKYGAGEVRKYYSKFDAAVRVKLSKTP